MPDELPDYDALYGTGTAAPPATKPKRELPDYDRLYLSADEAPAPKTPIYESPALAKFVGGGAPLREVPRETEQSTLIPGFKPRSAAEVEPMAMDDLREADALTGQHFADNPEYLAKFRGAGGFLDPEKTAAHLAEIRKSHTEAIPAGAALAAHFGRTVASGTTLGLWKGGMSDEEDRLVSANPAVQGPAGSAVGAAGVVLAAANPIGPIARLTKGAQALGMGRFAAPAAFGLATGVEHRSVEAGLEAAIFVGAAGAAGKFLKGKDPGFIRRVAGEAAAVLGVGAGMAAAKGEPIDWSSQAAQAALFGALAGVHKSPLSPEAPKAKPVPPEFSPVETLATKARARMAEAVAKAAPELPPEEHARIVETGDMTGLPPEVAARIAVETRPIVEEHAKAIGEARKAEAGAEPVGPVEAFKAAQEAHARGEDPLAAAEAVRAEGYDPSLVPVDPAPVQGPRAPIDEGPVGADIPDPFAGLPVPKSLSMEPSPPVSIGNSPAEPPASARTEAPTEPAPAEPPRVLTKQPKKPRPQKPKSLSQVVRAAGGFDRSRAGAFGGELDMLRQKDSGTSRLVKTKAKGGRSAEELMQVAREAGFDIPEDMDPGAFIQRVAEDVRTGGTDRSAQIDDAEATGAAELRRGVEAEAPRWEDATPEQRAEYARSEEARLAELDREAEARRAEGNLDTSFEFGFNEGDPVEYRTPDGDTVDGTFVRRTDARTVIDTPDGRQRIPHEDVEVGPSRDTAETLGVVDAKSKVRPIRRGEIGAAGVALPPDPNSPEAKVARAVKASARVFHDWVTMKVAPRISRSNPDAGAVAGSLMNSGTTAAMVAPEWSRVVFGDAPPEARQKFTDAAVEFNLQTLRDKAQADVASAPNDMARIAAQARLDAIKTHLGDPDFSFKTKADLDAYWNGPEAKAFREKHRALWTGKDRLAEGFPSPEEMFAYLTKKGVSTEDLISTDPRDEMRLNMVALRDAKGEETSAKQILDAKKKGDRFFQTGANPENIRQKPHPYAKEFTGSGREYLRDYDGLIANTYGRVLDRYMQARFMDALETGKDIVRVKDGEKGPDAIKGEKAVKMPVELSPTKIVVGEDGKSVRVPSHHYYARESVVPEIDQMLRLNKAVGRSKFADALNASALFGLADNAWNLALDTMIVGSAPGTGLRSKAGITFGSVVNNLVAMGRVLKYAAVKPADHAARDLRLTNLGAFREGRTPEWTAESFRADLRSLGGVAGIPFKALGRLSARVHEAGRYVLDEAYTALGKHDPKTYPPDDPVARREFINRLGQYVGRGMGRLTQMARDSAVLPFITSQRKGAAEVLRKATLSGGGVRGTPAFVRFGQAMKFIGPLTIIALLNTQRTGNPTGRPGIPFGAIDSGEDDEHGNPLYSDFIGDITGVKPALTATGVRAFATAKKRDFTDGQTAESVFGSLVNSWLVKFASSPTTGFGYRLLSGKDPYYDSRPKTAARPGEAEADDNAAFALREAFQPANLVLAATGLKRKEDPEVGDAAMETFPNFALKRGARDVTTLPERIRYRQASERADYMISQFKNLTIPQRMAWIEDEMKRWEPGEVQANIRRLRRAAGKP